MRNRILGGIAFVAMLFTVSFGAGVANAGDVIWTGAAPIKAAPTAADLADQKGTPKPGQLNAKASCGSPSRCFEYVGVSQFIGTAGQGADVVTVTTSQHNTYLNTANDAHTLWELSAQSDGSTVPNGNIIEIGWTKDNAVCGQTTSPCLFVFRWINGVKGAYCGGGFVDNPTEAVNCLTPLAVTASGASPTVFYQYRIGRANSTKCDNTTADGTPVQTTATLGFFTYQQNVGSTRIIGCFPDKIWTDAGETFTKIHLVQAFNEISSTDDHPCSDMGSGIFGVSTTPSGSQWVNNYTISGAPAGVTADWTINSPTIAPSFVSPNFARIYQNSGTDHRVGGPFANGNGGSSTGSVGSC